MATKQGNGNYSPTNPLMIDIKELARLLSVSVSTIRRYERLGKIPEARRFGTTKRWFRKEIISWMNNGCPTLDEWKARFPNRIALPPSAEPAA